MIKIFLQDGTIIIKKINMDAIGVTIKYQLTSLKKIYMLMDLLYVLIFYNAIVLLNVVVLVALVVFVFTIRNLHGLEHKLIHAYKKGLLITLENVKAQKKESPFCGGTLIGVIIFLEILLGVLGINSLLMWIIVPTVGYELFVLAGKDKWYSKIIFFPGFLLQQLTTGNGSKDEKILQYITAFQAFVEIENQ